MLHFENILRYFVHFQKQKKHPPTPTPTQASDHPFCSHLTHSFWILQIPEQARLLRGACLGSRPCLLTEPQLMVLKWRPDGDRGGGGLLQCVHHCLLLLSCQQTQQNFKFMSVISTKLRGKLEKKKHWQGHREVNGGLDGC